MKGTIPIASIMAGDCGGGEYGCGGRRLMNTALTELHILKLLQQPGKIEKIEKLILSLYWQY